MNNDEPIDIYIPGDPDDPRNPRDLGDGIQAHHGPPLHPADVTVVDGIRVTTPSRTLIDLAEIMDADELRSCFAAARARGLLDADELAAARARVEWRPSLAMFDAVCAEFT